MTKRIYETLARFFAAAGETSEPLDVGSFGPDSKYSSFERCRIGPLISAAARDGIIVRAGGGNSQRTSRNGAFTQFWCGASATSCRRLSREFGRLAETVDDDGERVSGPKQLALPLEMPTR